MYDANTDAMFSKTRVTRFYARFVRVIPTRWHYGVCMKVEIKGCEGDPRLFIFSFYQSVNYTICLFI